MKDIGDFLREGLAADKKLSSLAPLAVPWHEVVGEAVAAHCRPRSLHDGVLVLSADSPVWAHQLGFFKDSIKDKMNTYLGEDLVKEIRVDARGISKTGYGDDRGRRDPLI